MNPKIAPAASDLPVALLTGGGDRPYALGLASALIDQGIPFDFIGSDFLDDPGLHGNPLVRFLNLRGKQGTDASVATKSWRVMAYYVRLIAYAARSNARIFHLLWNNKFETFDRTFLTLYYKLLGKRVVLTIHNVNARIRDGSDTRFNRFTLRVQYRLVDHLFVHTDRMKIELQTDFQVPDRKISVIPFGINSTAPDTALTTSEAKQSLGLAVGDKCLLFFGYITPYKGLEFLVDALVLLAKTDRTYRLIIAGQPKGSELYWESIRQRILGAGIADYVVQKIGFVSDADTEIYFKATDVLVLPYTHIFQSGVLSLGYNFGLPVIASDVGSLRDDIAEGRTGYVCKPKDSVELAACIERYFASDLYQRLGTHRLLIHDFAKERYSWTKVGAITTRVYDTLDQ